MSLTHYTGFRQFRSRAVSRAARSAVILALGSHRDRRCAPGRIVNRADRVVTGTIIRMSWASDTSTSFFESAPMVCSDQPWFIHGPLVSFIC